ncbi:MAG: AraC family transcriptional regulator [Verrucomicrobiota bacterium]
MSHGCFDDDFFSSDVNPEALLPLFNALPSVFFFAKDLEGRFTAMNNALLAMIGVSPDEVLGATDYDLFDHDLAESYRAEDRQVVESGHSVLNAPWWVPNLTTGDIHWYSSSKIPIRNQDHTIIGVAGVMRPMEDTAELTTEHRAMTEIAAYIEKHFDQRLTVEHLAEVTGHSKRNFQRVFKRIFKSTPIEHLARVRIRQAAIRLAESEDSLAAIAVDCGFHDQAHFSNQFKRLRGMTPSDYRSRFGSVLR